MRDKLFQRLTSALCVLALLLSLTPTAFAADKPAESCNRNKPLFNGDKNLTRAQICTIIVRVINLANSQVPSTSYGN